MSMSEPLTTGFCFICNSEVEGSLRGHLDDAHVAEARKPRAEKISWQHRIDNIMAALDTIRNDDEDPLLKIRRLDDDVIQELYLVRAKLTNLKHNSAKRVREDS